MKLLAVAVLTILAVAPETVAQDRAKFEVFGGYSLEHIPLAERQVTRSCPVPVSFRMVTRPPPTSTAGTHR